MGDFNYRFDDKEYEELQVYLEDLAELIEYRNPNRMNEIYNLNLKLRSYIETINDEMKTINNMKNKIENILILCKRERFREIGENIKI